MPLLRSYRSPDPLANKTVMLLKFVTGAFCAAPKKRCSVLLQIFYHSNIFALFLLNFALRSCLKFFSLFA